MEGVFLMEGCGRLCRVKLGTMGLGTPLEVSQSTVIQGLSSTSWKVKCQFHSPFSDLGLTWKNPLLGMWLVCD